MQWIETIHIRAYSNEARDQAVGAYLQMAPELYGGALEGAKLLQDVKLPTDIVIFLTWTGRLAKQGKSQLGLRLQEIFSEFGQINCVTWAEETSLQS